MERTLPANIEAERGVLGSLIIDPEAVHLVADWLHVEDFYRNGHRTLYEAILTLYNHHQPADFITLTEVLEQRGKLEEIGGASEIVDLINHVPTSGNIEYYARIVTQKAHARRLIHAAGKIAALAYEEQEDAQEQAERIIFGLQRQRGAGFQSLTHVLSEVLEDLEALQQRKQHLLGVPTGFRDLDSALGGGLQRSDLIVVAGRPGFGKTSLALAFTLHAFLHQGKRVAFFSLEMTAKQLAMRLLAMQGNVDQRRLRMGIIDDWSTLVVASDTLSEAEGKVWINDSSDLTDTAVRSQTRNLLATEGIDMVVVDYLQLLEASREDGKTFAIREQEVARISRSLKAMAKECHIPVIALAQLSRAVEARQAKRPQLSDLRESGAIENDADVILFISPQEQTTGTPSTILPVDIIIGKQRNGPVGEIRVAFSPSRTRFADLEVSE